MTVDLTRRGLHPVEAAEAVYDRSLPSAPDCERAVLAVILVSEGSALGYQTEDLRAEHFHHRSNATIYESMLRVRDDLGKVDYILLRDDLRRRGQLDQVGGVEYLSQLAAPSPVPDVTAFGHYVEQVVEAARLRELVRLGNDVQRKAMGYAKSSEIAAELTERIPVSRFHLQTSKTRKQAFSDLTALRDLLAEQPHPIDYLIDGLFIAGGTSMMLGRPKVGKSTLARFCAACVATGAEFLGRRVRRGPVVLCQFEEHKDILREQLRTLGLTGSEEFFIWADAAPQDGVAWFERVIDRHKPALAVVDPLFKLVRLKDVNDYAGVSASLEPLNDIARRTGTHLLLVHHLSKGGDQVEEGGSLGSTAIDGLVDSILTLQRRENARTIRSLQRYGLKLNEVVLDFEPATGRFVAAGEFAEIRVETAMLAVNEALGVEELTEAEIREKVGGDTGLTGKHYGGSLR